ncbi:hypothetical protein H0H93_005839 [Arthromyces matolae]|nr:hypothetical protein H0H93_005839 [Arthromyces matolae]
MTATPATVARQYKQLVYIDVPPSPYPILSSVSRKNVLTSLSLKENALLPSASLPETPLLKRKPSEHDLLVSNSKKQKIHQKPAVTPINAPPEYPNGFVYCHQCSRKCDAPGKYFKQFITSVTYTAIFKLPSIAPGHPP